MTTDPRFRRRSNPHRVNDYFAFGVPYLWIVDPRTRKEYNCTPEGMTETTVFRTESPELIVPLDVVFEF